MNCRVDKKRDARGRKQNDFASTTHYAPRTTAGGGARSWPRRRRASTSSGTRPIIMERICKRRPSTRCRRASSSATCYWSLWGWRSSRARRASSRRSSSSRTSSRRSSSTRSARPPLPLPRPCKRGFPTLEKEWSAASLATPSARRRLRNWTCLRGWIPEKGVALKLALVSYAMLASNAPGKNGRETRDSAAQVIVATQQ